MGFGPQRKVKDMRNTKLVKKDARTNATSGPGEGMAVKRDQAKGKKYDGPNYPAKDEHITPFGGK